MFTNTVQSSSATYLKQIQTVIIEQLNGYSYDKMFSQSISLHSIITWHLKYNSFTNNV